MDRSNYNALRKTQLILRPRLSDTGCKQAEAADCLQLAKAMLIEKGLSHLLVACCSNTQMPMKKKGIPQTLF